ncbi:MAG: 4'-phosphopantetheinyl transferase superfamily protein [Alphaproteobacteria bacterium]
MNRPAVRARSIALADRSIDLWWVELPDNARVAAAADMLSPTERTRLARMKVPARRREFVAGRVALRRILGRYLGVAPAAVDIETMAGGKPRIAGSTLQFSLAHSRDCVAVAVARAGALGVDIEAARALLRPDRLAQTLLAPAALAAWRALPPTRQTGPLLYAWTATEAVIKALGRSLPGALRSVKIDGLGTEWPVLASIDGRPGPARRWVIRYVEAPTPYTCAVACDRPIDGIRLRRFRWPPQKR